MPKDRVQRVLQQSVGDVLKRRGYQKQTSRYVRASGELTQMIDVQLSQWSQNKATRFTLNCGVYVPGLSSAYWNTPDPARPKLTDCCVSARVGMLSPSRLDLWWEVTDGDDSEKDGGVVAAVRSAVTGLALPFVERFETVHDIAGFLTEDRTGAANLIEPRATATRLVYAAVLWRKLGEEARSRTCLDEAVQQAQKTPLESVVETFVARFGRLPEHA